MPSYDLDHVTLGVRHLYESAERLRRETGLRSHEGGWLQVMPTAHRVIPLPGDAFINVESVIDHHAELPPGVDAFRTWFEETTRRADHWMTWNLRARSHADLEAVAHRLGGEVVTSPGARRPDGTSATTVMAPGDAGLTWARGLPNWYYHEDMSRLTHSGSPRRVIHGGSPTAAHPRGSPTRLPSARAGGDGRRPPVRPRAGGGSWTPG
ncbi:VOC family protein [Nonomuraea deserti]|uniref:VOC family protein n=1 Tax=Nonomuraea deserti TaxID=1848322 RepID=UPI001404ED56|nr:VOC family protein [Nonomuraea deserti]